MNRFEKHIEILPLKNDETLMQLSKNQSPTTPMERLVIWLKTEKIPENFEHLKTEIGFKLL